jgi:hypothetical protein
MIKYFWITNPWIRIQQGWNFRTIYVAYAPICRTGPTDGLCSLKGCTTTQFILGS